MLSWYTKGAPASPPPSESSLALFDASYAMAGSINQVTIIELLVDARRDPEFGAAVRNIRSIARAACALRPIP